MPDAEQPHELFLISGNYRFYSGSLYDAAHPNGNHLTTIILKAAW
jgi:hypothetical protein